ncbi:MAG: NADPH-dependent 7-cyano-7-deazaguanine reductase QueF [Chromatiales bacterium]|nr:MAG: NADPH-dependent 7-cyano-7-deazaguanine reductase QueF [Chromatiales bacterium]
MNLPLGHETDYPHKYAPEVLCPIPRSQSRAKLGIGHELPFAGVDIWNAWDLTWLGLSGLPRVATAELHVPADSPNIVESKSLKLYLGSFAMSPFESTTAVAESIARDLAACVGAPVKVSVLPVAGTEARRVARLAGACLDELDVACSDWEVDTDLLHSDPSDMTQEDVHTHLLRSLCPVTSQPDIGSLQISYRGPRINHAALLQYVVSFREHNDFHEACIERMFVDLMDRCGCEALTVQARYQRRGGIDINPLRSNCSEKPLNLRLWRQ